MKLSFMFTCHIILLLCQTKIARTRVLQSRVLSIAGCAHQLSLKSSASTMKTNMTMQQQIFDEAVPMILSIFSTVFDMIVQFFSKPLPISTTSPSSLTMCLRMAVAPSLIDPTACESYLSFSSVFCSIESSSKLALQQLSPPRPARSEGFPPWVLAYWLMRIFISVFFLFFLVTKFDSNYYFLFISEI